MQWIFCTNPVRGFLIKAFDEPCLDGFAKVLLKTVGSYRVINENTVHVRIFDETEKTLLHDVVPNEVEAQYFILKNVLSPEVTAPEIATV